MVQRNDGNPYAPFQPQQVVEEIEVKEIIPEDITNIKEIVSWVGDDKDRAQLVMDAENNSVNSRKTLLKSLEEVLNG